MRRASVDHLSRYAPDRPELVTDDDHFDFLIERDEIKRADGAGVTWFIIDAGTGEVAGHIGLSNIVRGVFQNAAAGWALGKPFTGRGLATAALLAMLDYAFDSSALGLGLHRVEANIQPDNEPSIRLAGRCGFRREGLIKSMLRINGAWRDHASFAILSDEHQSSGSRIEQCPVSPS
jgi:ribosomal-protein-alanine N-acetyltransferase